MNSTISYPTPPYQNFPINAQFFTPSRFVISNITIGVTTVVTTSVDHDYIVGQLVRLLIPSQNGIIQLNGVKAYVISIPSSNSMELGVSSIGFSSFVVSSSPQQPQIVAIGDAISGAVNQTKNNQLTYLPGSFRNIS